MYIYVCLYLMCTYFISLQSNGYLSSIYETFETSLKVDEKKDLPL